MRQAASRGVRRLTVMIVVALGLTERPPEVIRSLGRKLAQEVLDQLLVFCSGRRGQPSADTSEERVMSRIAGVHVVASPQGVDDCLYVLLVGGLGGRCLWIELSTDEQRSD